MAFDIHELSGDIANRIADGIRALAGGSYDFTDWKNVSAMVRSGNVDKIPLGVIFKVPHSVFGDIYFITRARNQHKVAGEPSRPTLTIQSLYLLSLLESSSTAKTFVYDRSEGFCKVVGSIAANTVCKFTTIAYLNWAAGTWHFTPTAQIASGSILAINRLSNSSFASCKVQVFANATASSPLAEYSISSGEGNATKDLGTWGNECNHPHRVFFGSNNAKESNLFQWLNSDAVNFSDRWQPQTKFDMLDSSYAGMAGFLAGFPEEFRGALGLCSVPEITNSVYESSGSSVDTNQRYEHNGYFFLPSQKEIYGYAASEYDNDDIQFHYYKYVGTENKDKMMYARGSAEPVSYWIRTPNISDANDVKECYKNMDGTLSQYGASNALGLTILAILS